jgi:hypothetical protein
MVAVSDDDVESATAGLPACCVMRQCLVNRSLRVNAAPQRQVYGFSLVSSQPVSTFNTEKGWEHSHGSEDGGSDVLHV